MLFGIAYGQGGYLKPNNSYGTRQNRVAPDSVLHIPILPDTSSLNSTQTWPQIRVVGDSLWWYKGKWRNLSLSIAPSEVWKLAGNAGTVDGTNFIGTTDNKPFNIRVNNQKAGRVDGLLNTSYGYLSLNDYNGGAGSTGNTAIGAQALQSIDGGDDNAGVGSGSLLSTTSGVNNVGVGVNAGITNTTGSNNTSIGALSDVLSDNLSNATAIGYRAAVNQSNSLVLGSINGINGASSNTKVGIGTTTPGWPLHVVGQVVMDGNVEITDHLEALGDVDTYGLLTANNGFTSVNEAFFNDKITVSTGPNPIAGTATLVAGTVTVNTDRVTTNSIIFLTKNTPAGVVGTQLSVPSASIVDNVSFIINSNSATETSTVNWFIIN